MHQHSRRQCGTACCTKQSKRKSNWNNSSTVSFTTTYVGEMNGVLGTLSWPNPNKYKNFIASGEYCTGTHFTCERPDFNIQTASTSDVAVAEDLPLADAETAGNRAYSAGRAPQGECNSATGFKTAGNNAVATVGSSNPGDSPAGSFNSGGAANAILPIDPKSQTPSPVPLPASVWFLLAAISGLGVYRRQSLHSGIRH
jgi:hypothetical protein